MVGVVFFFFARDARFMSFLFRKSASAVAAAEVPAPPKENLVPQIDACIMTAAGSMHVAETCSILLARFVTAAHAQDLSSDEYAHLLVALYHATNQGKGRVDLIDSTLLFVLQHAAHHVLDEALHEHVSIWCAGASKFVYVLLLLALANNRARVTHATSLYNVLYARIIACGVIERIKYSSNSGTDTCRWEALFKIVSARDALLLMACIDDTPVELGYSCDDKNRFLWLLGPRLCAGPANETIDALINCRRLWTTTPSAPLSFLGAQIWEWLHKHPEWARALEIVDAKCFAPLKGWLLVRNTQNQPSLALPRLVGNAATLFAELRTYAPVWLCEQPALLVDAVHAVHDWNIGPTNTIYVLEQAWMLMDTTWQTRFANSVTRRTALEPKTALHIALRLGSLLPNAGGGGGPSSTIFAHVLQHIPADIFGALDELQIEDGEACIYRTLALVCRTPVYQAHFSEQSLGNLAVHCTEEQLHCLLWTANALPSRSRIYVHMVKLALEPTPLSLTEGRKYAAFSSRMSRAWRLRPILMRLAADQGWADFALAADLDAPTLALVTKRKQVMKQACIVHVPKDLVNVCVGYV
jgi:hypothetical protein